MYTTVVRHVLWRPTSFFDPRMGRYAVLVTGVYSG